MGTENTQKVVGSFFEAIGRGDVPTILGLLADDIEFELPQHQYNRIIPYLGVMRGPQAVAEAFRIRAETTEVLDYALRDLIVQDDRAAALVYTKATCRATGKVFEIEDMHRFVVGDSGKIVKWKAYFDSVVEVEAFRANQAAEILEAVQKGDLQAVQRLADLGADINTREPGTGLTLLMIAAGRGDATMTAGLLKAGADPFMVDPLGGASALHKACQGGNVEVVRLLVEAGVHPDVVAPTTGHTPLMDALWFKYLPIIQYLTEGKATLNMSAHYGFSLQEHLDFEVKVTTTGREKLMAAVELVNKRRAADEARIQGHKLMDAVLRNDVEAAKQLIAEGVDIDERYPLTNGFNDDHTALLVAARNGCTEIVAELLKAGADPNAVEPTFGAVPLHKSVYNGHVEITKMLIAQPGINLDYQGYTNGYTALHDALWHGFAEISDLLVEAGARLDLVGHDGKTPLDMAVQYLGADHPTTAKIRSRM